MDTNSVLWWFAQQASRVKVRIFAAGALSIVAGLVSAADPLLMRYLIDHALPGRLVMLSRISAFGIALCFVTRFILSGIGSLVNFRIVQIISQHLRVSLLEHITELSAEWHESVFLGEKLSRFEQDVSQIAQFGADIGNSVARTLVMSIVNVGIMLSLNWRITVAVIPLLPFFFWVLRRFEKPLVTQSTQAQYYVGRASSSLTEQLDGIPQLQLLGAERDRTHRTVQAWKAMIHAQWQQRKTEVAFGNSITGVMSVALFIVLGLGVREYFRGALTTGGLVALYACTSRVFDPITVAMDIYSRSQRVMASGKRLKEFEDLTTSVPDHGTVWEVPTPLRAGIACRGIFFAYGKEPPVLHGVTMEIAGNEHVALVGRSGSGKSSLARLLSRVVDPKDGVVFLEGKPASEYQLQALRRAISYVPQQTLLFSGTIRENLCYGLLDVAPEEIEQVVDVSQLREVIDRLPEGLETLVGPEAVGFSGGERQRLSIARVLLRRSPILILDEATSALDLPTEEAVFRGIAAAYRERSLVLISHRLQSLMWVDRIIVLEAGKIEVQGTHHALFQTSALYRSLFESAVANSSQNSGFAL